MNGSSLIQDRGKFSFGTTVCSPHSIAELLAEIKLLRSNHALRPRTILCVNSHIYNLACGDARLRDCFDAARIVAADGMAIVWAARLLGRPISERCNMTEAYHAFLCDQSMPASRGILIGCSQEEAAAAAEKANATSRHCQLVNAYSGFLGEEEYRKALAGNSEIDFVFLGMGSPQTELLAQIASSICPGAIVWGIGGGTIRIEAGTMTEAPAIFRRLGLQWLHRLGAEPGVLWRRYLLGNPIFIARILKLVLMNRRNRGSEKTRA